MAKGKNNTPVRMPKFTNHTRTPLNNGSNQSNHSKNTLVGLVNNIVGNQEVPIPVDLSKSERMTPSQNSTPPAEPSQLVVPITTTVTTELVEEVKTVDLPLPPSASANKPTEINGDNPETDSTKNAPVVTDTAPLNSNIDPIVSDESLSDNEEEKSVDEDSEKSIDTDKASDTSKNEGNDEAKNLKEKDSDDKKAGILIDKIVNASTEVTFEDGSVDPSFFNNYKNDSGVNHTDSSSASQYTVVIEDAPDDSLESDSGDDQTKEPILTPDLKDKAKIDTTVETPKAIVELPLSPKTPANADEALQPTVKTLTADEQKLTQDFNKALDKVLDKDVVTSSKTYSACIHELAFMALGAISIGVLMFEASYVYLLPNIAVNNIVFPLVSNFWAHVAVGGCLLTGFKYLNDHLGKTVATLATSATCAMSWYYWDNTIPVIIAASSIAFNLLGSSFERSSISEGASQAFVSLI